MNEFRFNHLQNRKRLKLPRPILYVGAAIILLAFFSIKTYKRASDAAGGPDVPPPSAVESPALLTAVETAEPPPAAPPPVPDAAPVADDGTGILSLDGEGERIIPPRRLTGDPPAIPPELLAGGPLEDPRVYVRVDRDGLVTDVKLVVTSGSDEVDHLVLDALEAYTFQPAGMAGQPVEYSSVVTVPLRPRDHSSASESIASGSR